MLYRPLGSTGEQVSVLGFGCMRLPVIGGRQDRIDVPLATEMLHYAFDHGVNYLDTGYPYRDLASEKAAYDFAVEIKATAKASACARCGQGEEVCTQNVPVADKMEEAAALLE